MNQSHRLNPEPTGVSTVDLLLLTAGFACGWVMQENSLFAVSDWNYRLPLWYGDHRSVLGLRWLQWLWACVVGLAFLVVGRRFRYDCRKRPAEWLVVALAIVLFESVYPAFRTGPVLSTGETVWIEPNQEFKWAYPAYLRTWGYPKPDRPFALDLWWPVFGESWQELAWIALPLTVLEVTTAILAWRLATLQPLAVEWKDDTAERVIARLKRFGAKKSYTAEDVKPLLGENFEDGMLICRLFLGISKDAFVSVFKDVRGSSGIGVKSYQADPGAFVDALIEIGLLEAMASAANHRPHWTDVLVERLRSGRGSAISGQHRGRGVEDFAQAIVAKVFGENYQVRCTFTGPRGQQAKCDFAIPSKTAARILVESRGYGATGSKMTDIQGDIRTIIADGNRFSFTSGATEDYEMNTKHVNILEGTYRTFDNRQGKYHRPDAEELRFKLLLKLIGGLECMERRLERAVVVKEPVFAKGFESRELV